MSKQYLIGMFALCLFVWAILVDNAVLPPMNALKLDSGAYSRYRVKKWDQGGKLDFLGDELLIYAVVKNREQLYYMDYKPNFEFTLKRLEQGTPVQMRYVNRFPKFWKRELYDVRANGVSALHYAPAQLKEKQKKIWKISGIMGGIFIFLVLVGRLSKPRKK